MSRIPISSTSRDAGALLAVKLVWHLSMRFNLKTLRSAHVSGPIIIRPEPVAQYADQGQRNPITDELNVRKFISELFSVKVTSTVEK